MIIKLENGLAEVEYTVGKRNYSKTVTISSLKEALVSDQGLYTPLLPFGTRYYSRKGPKHRIIIDMPAVVRGIKYVNSSQKVIYEDLFPYPWGLMDITLNENNGKYTFAGSSVYALKRPLNSENDTIYHYPVPNLYHNGGQCWGSVLTGEDGVFDSISQVGILLDYFYGSQFNTDLHPRMNLYSRYEDLLRDHKDKKALKSEILVSQGITFKNVIERTR